MSAISCRALRYGTGAHIALKCLHALEGQANDARWQAAAVRVLGAKAKSDQWDVIVQSLVNAGMVFRRGQLFVVSDDGLAFLGVVAEVVPRAEPLNVPERYVPPMRNLSAKYLVNVRSMREGAFDYRNIPSLHGDQRIAFETSLKISGGDAQA